MFSSLARAAAFAAVAALPAFAQAPAAASAQKPEFETGPFYAGPRVWLGNLNGAIAIGGQIERGLTQPGKYGSGIISGGLGIDYYSWSNDFVLGSYKYSVIPLQAFSNYHFVITSNKKLDPYAGLALVYQVVSASWSGGGARASAQGSGLDIAGQAGLRYFIKPALALQGQIGFGYGTLGLGATWRF
jgi:hypothetical protein